MVHTSLQLDLTKSASTELWARAHILTGNTKWWYGTVGNQDGQEIIDLKQNRKEGKQEGKDPKDK